MLESGGTCPLLVACCAVPTPQGFCCGRRYLHLRVSRKDQTQAWHHPLLALALADTIQSHHQDLCFEGTTRLSPQQPGRGHRAHRAPKHTTTPEGGLFAGISRSLHGPLSLSHWDLDPDRTEQNTGVVQQGRMRRLRSMARCLRQLGKNYARLPRTLCQPRYPHGGHSSLSPPLPESPKGIQHPAPTRRVAVGNRAA